MIEQCNNFDEWFQMVPLSYWLFIFPILTVALLIAVTSNFWRRVFGLKQILRSTLFLTMFGVVSWLVLASVQDALMLSLSTALPILFLLMCFSAFKHMSGNSSQLRLWLLALVAATQSLLVIGMAIASLNEIIKTCF